MKILMFLHIDGQIKKTIFLIKRGINYNNILNSLYVFKSTSFFL